ncbi:hypothetical protein ACFW4L_22075, partial [Streptomyces sp. NPDC058832]|uniref:hypothetical protein n=1 Tax=Streptomyces sp. NPDC058832 TaxID=3346646 RepID=UPI0036947F2D
MPGAGGDGGWRFGPEANRTRGIGVRAGRGWPGPVAGLRRGRGLGDVSGILVAAVVGIVLLGGIRS